LAWTLAPFSITRSGPEQQASQPQIQGCQPFCQAGIVILVLGYPECGFGQTAVNQTSQGMGGCPFNSALIHQRLVPGSAGNW